MGIDDESRLNCDKNLFASVSESLVDSPILHRKEWGKSTIKIAAAAQLPKQTHPTPHFDSVSNRTSGSNYPQPNPPFIRKDMRNRSPKLERYPTI